MKTKSSVNMTQKRGPLGYTAEEMENFQAHIAPVLRSPSNNVLHDKGNLGGIHIDLLYFPPTYQDPYIHLLTMGAGAYLMSNGKRAEFMITLPADWPMDIESWQDENNYWPIRLLQDVARFSITNNTFLDSFHTLAEQKNYAASTSQYASIFIPLESFPNIQLSSEKCVKILQIVPLTANEFSLCDDLCKNICIADGIPVSPNGFYVIDPSRQ